MPASKSYVFGVLLYFLLLGSQANAQFSLSQVTAAASWPIRANAAMFIVPYALTYSGGSTTANSLIMWGGDLGHHLSADGQYGDPDMWASTDGVTWTMIAGANTFNTTYYGSAIHISPTTPTIPLVGTSSFTAPSNGAIAVPQTYPVYPYSTKLHVVYPPTVNNAGSGVFLNLGGEGYFSSGNWEPSVNVFSSGGPTINSATTGQWINREGNGWTLQSSCTISGFQNSVCSLSGNTYPTATCSLSGGGIASAAGVVLSNGAVMLLNGYDGYCSNRPYATSYIVKNGNGLPTSGYNFVGVAPWRPRYESLALTSQSKYWSGGNGGGNQNANTPRNIVWNIGGCGVNTDYTSTTANFAEVPLNDVWASWNVNLNNNNNPTWVLLTANAAFPARCGIKGATTSDGVMVITGGRSAQSWATFPGYPSTSSGAGYWAGLVPAFSDVWTSLDGGYNWLSLPSSMQARDRPSVAFDSLNRLIIAGGRWGVQSNAPASGYASTSTSTPNAFAFANDVWRSSVAFDATSIVGWIAATQPGSYTPPNCIGLTSFNGSSVGGVSCSVFTTPPVTNPAFDMVQSTDAAPWFPRAYASAALIPYAISYTSGTVAAPGPVVTAPANSLYIWGSDMGHLASGSNNFGDLDIWYTSDSGVSWNLMGGAADFQGTYYSSPAVQSANTPTVPYSGISTSQISPQVPQARLGAGRVHDNVNKRFMQIGGDVYYSSGDWEPSLDVFTSGGTPITSTANGAVLNAEGAGWWRQTTLALPDDSPTYFNNPNYVNGGFESVSGRGGGKSFAGVVTDSKGVTYVLGGYTVYAANRPFPTNDVISNYPGLVNSPFTVVNQAAFSPRYDMVTLTMPSPYFSGADLIYVIGGCAVQGNNSNQNTWNVTNFFRESTLGDVWVSTNNGNSFTRLAASTGGGNNPTPWTNRCGLSGAINSNGVIVVGGGRTAMSWTTFPGYPARSQDSLYNALKVPAYSDMWTSMDGGYTWNLLLTAGGFYNRDRPTMIFDSLGYLWLMGGRWGQQLNTPITGYAISDYTPNGLAFANDVYISSVSFNSITTWISAASLSPLATIPECTGLIALNGETKSCSGSDNSLSSGAIAGIVIGVVVGVFIIGLLIFLCFAGGFTVGKVLKKKSSSSDDEQVSGKHEAQIDESQVRNDDVELQEHETA